MNVCMLALMVLLPSHSVPISGAPCATSGYTRAWDNLIHRTSISKNDTRYGLRQGSSKLGLSPAEKVWISKVTGNVICPGGPALKGSQGSAALIGRNDLIATNVHVLRNQDGTKRDDWPNCYFETQSQPPIRRKLKFFDPATVFGTRDAIADRNLDYAIVRLESPVLGVEPVSVAASAGSIKANQELVVVSAYQDSLKPGRTLDGNEPIIQACKSKDFVRGGEDAGTIMYSDCSGTAGASGSVTFARDENSRLIGVGIMTRSAKRSLDGKEYDVTATEGNHSTHLLFDGGFLRDIRNSSKIQINN